MSWATAKILYQISRINHFFGRLAKFKNIYPVKKAVKLLFQQQPVSNVAHYSTTMVIKKYS